MPRAPQYQQGTSGVAPVNARLQAPGVVQSGLGEGMERLGQTLTAIDQLNAQHDDTVARQQVLAMTPDVTNLVAQFKAQQGGNAVDGLSAAQKSLDDVRKQGLDGLKSPRAQRIFQQHFGTLYASAMGEINGHAIQQAGVQRDQMHMGELQQAQDAASGLYDNADDLKAGVGVVGQKAQALAAFRGMTGAAANEFIKQQQGVVYATAINTLVKDDKAVLASALFDAHHDEMTFEQRNAALDALRGPMQNQESNSIFQAALAGARAAPSAAQGAPGSTPHPSAPSQMPVANGRVTNTFEQHKERGSAGLDIGAPLGAAIHPIAGGVVEAVTQDDRAGRWVKVKHPDGTTSSYAHMGNQSVAVGDQVTPDTVLGTVGLTGHTTGPHVHLRVRAPDGADLDPQKLIGGTIGRATVVGSPTAARNYDQATVISNIKAMGLPLEKEQRAVSFAMRQMAQGESLLNDQYQDAADNLHQWIGNYQASHNGEDPPPDAIPSNIAGSVKPSYMAEMRGNLAKAQKAKFDAATKKEQENTALALKLQSYLEPDKFAQTDLRKYQGLVPFSDLSSLAEEQAKRRASARQWSSADASASALATFERRNPGLLPSNPGVKHPDEMAAYNRQRLAILDTVAQFADGIAAKGTIPTEAQLQQAVTQATKQIRFANGNVGHLYDIQFGNLTPQTVQTIRNNLRLRGVQNITDDDVVREYRRTARDSQGN
ncbi:M23 family metallopeptidase [Novosphingobium capsulatum]|uniref:M23 family metallopeptidase n=1 Tax=Novosphingobium capsulatum TaxID=13688 RepID=UPI0007892D40|nr:M23 family metallopeptidase [Novosphingobium capsulatum]WQD92766.1 M23 family metallopeptidase [Novosphingobium capsulatum]